MKYKSLRFRILFIIMSISVISLVLVGVYSYDVQQKLLYKVSNEKLMIMMKTIKKSEKDRYRRYHTYLTFTTKNKKFISDILSGNNESIYNYLIKKQFTFKSADKDFEHFHLYDSRGIPYDIQVEDNFDNHLEDNFVLSRAMNDKKASKGYVVYHDSGYYYSVVMPIFNNSEIIAYLEVGMKADSSIKLASKVGRYKYALYINKQNKFSKTRELGEVAISNSPIFEDIDIDQAYIYRYANQNVIINYKSQYYLLNQYDIETPHQKNFAQNILANNVTSFVLDNQKSIIIYTIFSIIVLIIMYMVMYIYIGKLIKKLLQDEEELLSQKDEIQLIMDNSDSFVLVYENYELTFVNKPFLYFVNRESLDEFVQKYKSIELLF